MPTLISYERSNYNSKLSEKDSLHQKEHLQLSNTIRDLNKRIEELQYVKIELTNKLAEQEQKTQGTFFVLMVDNILSFALPEITRRK